jgi:hypothetical protein
MLAAKFRPLAKKKKRESGDEIIITQIAAIKRIFVFGLCSKLNKIHNAEKRKAASKISAKIFGMIRAPYDVVFLHKNNNISGYVVQVRKKMLLRNTKMHEIIE